MDLLSKYMHQVSKDRWDKGVIAQLATLDYLETKNSALVGAILKEFQDQTTTAKLIASENYSSLPVQLAQANIFSDKYAEGCVGRRFYSGCENVDQVESGAVEAAKRIFNSEHAYVQAATGSEANTIAYWAYLVKHVQQPELQKIGKNLNALSEGEFEALRPKFFQKKLMGLSLSSGGHLTHGCRLNSSGKMFQVSSYEVDPSSGLLDYDQLAKQVKQERPDVIVAGYSAYPRALRFDLFREIADSVGAALFSDMAHFSGLVAGKVFQGPYDPIPYSDIVTSTTHKTLRGPRGGLVLCKRDYADIIDRSCPSVIGGPAENVIAAKLVAFQEALQPTFKEYANQIVKNCQAFCDELLSLGCSLWSGGSDNHLLVINVKESFGLNGLQAEGLLAEAGLRVNRNVVPGDSLGVWFTSGIRIGTPAMTTRGMKEGEMRCLAQCINKLLKSAEPKEKTSCYVEESVLQLVRSEVSTLCSQFPLFPERSSDADILWQAATSV